MFELGLSTPGFVNEQLFADCEDAGIKHLEISVNRWASEALDFNELKAWSEKYGVNLWSFHLPFYPFADIEISKEDMAEKSISYLSQFIKKGSEIGIDKYIIPMFFILNSSFEEFPDTTFSTTTNIVCIMSSNFRCLV